MISVLIYDNVMEHSGHSQMRWSGFFCRRLIARVGMQGNPSHNDVSRTHVCNLVRQVAMIFYTSEQDLLIPGNSLRLTSDRPAV